jgi:hypothetical protein
MKPLKIAQFLALLGAFSVCSREAQKYRGKEAERPPSEVVTIVFSGRLDSHINVQVGEKRVQLHNGSQLPPGTYHVGQYGPCVTRDGIRIHGTLFKLLLPHSEFTAEAGDTVTFYTDGTSAEYAPFPTPFIRGTLPTCYGENLFYRVTRAASESSGPKQ